MKNYKDQTPKKRCFNCTHSVLVEAGYGSSDLRCLESYKMSAKEFNRMMDEATDCSWVVPYDAVENNQEIAVSPDGVCDCFKEGSE